MIANFYDNYNGKKITSKNIEVIPQEKSYITFNEQFFYIDLVVLDLSNCEYNIYVVKV